MILLTHFHLYLVYFGTHLEGLPERPIETNANAGLADRRHHPRPGRQFTIKGRELDSADSMIMVVNRAGTAADNLKELIEFMDAPHVCTATPAKWQQQLGDSRLEAVFIGPDLTDKDVRSLVDGIGKLDPNIPIVMITDGDEE